MSEATTTLATTAATTLATTPASKSAPDFLKRGLKEGTSNTEVTVTTTTQPTTTTTGVTTEATTGVTTVGTQAPVRKRKLAKGYQDAPGAKEIAEAAGEIAKASKDLAATTKAAIEAKEKPAAAPDNMTPKEKRQIAVLEEMEKLYPDNPEYKGIAGRSKKYLEEFADWEADWKKKNPDADDDAFDEAVDKRKEELNIVWDEEDFAEARVNLRLSPVIEEKKKLETKLSDLEKDREESALKPKIQAVVTSTAKELAKEFGEDIAAAVNPDGTFDTAKIEAAITKDSVSAPILFEAVQQAQDFAASTMLAFSGKQAPLLDRVYRYCLELEKEFVASEQKDKEGRPFVTMEDYRAMTKAEQDKHCCLTPEVVTYCANQDIIKGAKEHVAQKNKEIEEVATQRGWKKTDAATTSSATTQPPAEKKVKPESPESSAGTPSESAAPGTGAGASTAPTGLAARFKSGVRIVPRGS